MREYTVFKPHIKKKILHWSKYHMLFVFLYDTLMVVTEVTERC